MNLGDPQQDVLEAITRDDYRHEVKDIDFGSYAFNIAERHQQSDDELDDNGSSVESEDDFDDTKFNIPSTTQINENPEILKRIKKDKSMDVHASLLSEVQDLISMLGNEEIEIPEKFVRVANNPKVDTQQLRQLKIALNDLYDSKTTANYFTDWILQLSVMVSTFFNGEKTIPFLDIKPNLTGYSNRVKANTNSLNKENLKVARKINKKIGKSTTTVFKWASMIILPGLITIGVNHGNKRITDHDKHDGLDDDDDESAEEDSVESEYVSDEEDDD